MAIHSGFPMKNGDFPWLPEGNLLVPEGNLLVPEDFPGSSRTIFLVQQVVAPAAAENGLNGPSNFDPQPLDIGLPSGVIKHGMLENGPFIGDCPICYIKPPFSSGIFHCHV